MIPRRLNVFDDRISKILFWHGGKYTFKDVCGRSVTLLHIYDLPLLVLSR